MLILWALGLFGLAVSYFAGSYFWTGWLIVVAVALASIEVIDRDAKAINKMRGRKVVDGIAWGLLDLLLWIIVIPLYAFYVRRNALRIP